MRAIPKGIGPIPLGKELPCNNETLGRCMFIGAGGKGREESRSHKKAQTHA